jgi:DNA repair photolyase
MKKPATGTREWAQKTVNCVLGCEHDCRYCYARYNMVDRFKKMLAKDWPKSEVRPEEVRKKRAKYSGVVMFPSTHDITPSNLDACVEVLRNLLKVGNTVLLVSKPHVACIQRIVDEFADYKKSLMFRFTVGAVSDKILSYWEPGAPTFDERLRSLKLAFDSGFKTSISCEPLLEPWNAKTLFETLIPYVNWEFWIGKLNKADKRVRLDDGDRTMLDALLSEQTDDAVMSIYRMLKDHPLIRWKDAYMEVISRCR